MNLLEIKPGATVQIIYFGGHQSDPKPARRIVERVLKNHLVLSDGYKYRKVDGRCMQHDIVIVGEIV